jgi:hypothetical protein
VLEALVALQDPQIVPFLLSVLRSPTDSVRRSCLRALRRFRDAALIDHVKPLMLDPSPAVRAQAIALLWQFPWERKAHLESVIFGMLTAPEASEEARQGLYLVGTLRLEEEKPRAMAALESPDLPRAFEAAVALLKLDDRSGAKALERAVLSESDEPARRLEALVRRGELPKTGAEFARSLLHQHHLHYPSGLPVGESLDARLADMPEACLRALRPHYGAKEERSELQKLDRELRTRRERPAVRGAVALRDLRAPWREMAEVVLLSHGYEIRDDAELVVSDERSMSADLAQIRIGGPNAVVVRDHYAPSELIAAVRSLSGKV